MIHLNVTHHSARVGPSDTGFIGIRLDGWEKTLWFSHTFKDDHAPVEVARVVTQKINQAIRQRIEEIREEAYEAGWKAAKAKKRRFRTFFGSISSTGVGY